MSDRIIHNSTLDYVSGSPYAVFTYSIADFENLPFPMIHLYMALIKQHGIDDPGKITGKKMKRHIDIEDGDREAINRILKNENLSHNMIEPRKIYEGVTIMDDILPPGNGYFGIEKEFCRLKDHIPMYFDESETVLQVARYDELYNHDLYNLARTDVATDKKRTKWLKRIDREMKKYKNSHYYKSAYTSLQPIIDHWLEGKIYIKDFNSFTKKSDFGFVRDNEDVMVMRDIDIYTPDFSASERETVVPYANRLGKIIQKVDSVYYISNVSHNAKYAHKDLEFRPWSREQIVRWAITNIREHDTKKLEENGNLKIHSNDMLDHLKAHLQGLGFKTEGVGISLYDPVNDMEAVQMITVGLPYKAIKRFRETGELFAFDSDKMEEARRELAKQRLMGCGTIETIEACYDPDTFDIVGFDVTYKKPSA